MRAFLHTVIGLHDHDWGLPAWGAAAIASLAAGVWIALQPDRSIDFHLVRVWLEQWLSSGTSVYPVEWLRVDYPPHALVLLSPLRLLPEASAVYVQLALNVAASVGMAWMLTTWMTDQDERSSLPASVAFAAMVLSWGAIRVGLWNGQTVAIAIVAGIYAVRASADRPWLAGLAFVVAACKPTLGAGFGLLLLLRGHHRSLVVAAGGILLLTVGYDLSVGLPPLASIPEYVESLQRMYTGDSYVRGVTTVRALMFDLSGGHPASETAFVVYSVLTLLALVITAWPVRHRPNAQALIATACLLWTLVALPNQRYYLVLLAPVVWLLVWRPDQLAPRGARWPAWTARGVVLFNVIDGPLTLRRLADYSAGTFPVLADIVWRWSYLAAAPVILALYVIVLRAIRRTPEPPTPESPVPRRESHPMP